MIAAATRSMHPAHLADLRASGLTDETIGRAGLYSARPGDLGRLTGRNLPEGSSGLVIPYADAFARIKIFPALTPDDGGTIKYLQRPGSPVRAYVTALDVIGVREAILADASVPLRLVEGEKKALALCQAGFPAVGLGGLWNFRTKNLPDHALIPDLESIAWRGRSVFLVPDSDVWSRPDLLVAVYRLGRLLEARGATVRAVRLPEARR